MDWHQWFAWHPVMVTFTIYEGLGFSSTTRNYAWLRWVDRRRTIGPVTRADTDWEYRVISDRYDPI